MTILSFLCRLIPGSRCEPPRPEQATSSATSADLGQREAKNEALREEQLKHMGGGTEARAARPYAASSQSADVLTSQVPPQQSAAPRTTADLGQKEAKVEAQSKEQSQHMEGGPAAKSAKRKKRRPDNPR
jgi:hypothetical protein